VLREISGQQIILNIDVLREELYVKSAEWYVPKDDETVGVIRISGFDLTTPTALRESMDALLDRGVERFVFDLRDNGGGDLKSVVACVSLFLERNDVILSTQDKDGRKVVYTANQRLHDDEYASCDVLNQDIGKYRGYSFAVLVNDKTASAAELFAAVFRDYSLGKLVGTKTYGKGSVQGIYSLERIGLEGGVRVTTKMYFPPCGESYNGEGIMPDVEVEPNAKGAEEEQDAQLASAIMVIK
jgi:carboxyl-terminal processing protease